MVYYGVVLPLLFKDLYGSSGKSYPAYHYESKRRCCRGDSRRPSPYRHFDKIRLAKLRRQAIKRARQTAR